MKKGTVTMLKKKYYDGFTVHDILNKHLDDGHKILELLTAFADADGVDAVPVRHGKWIDMDEQSYTWKIRCSCCDHERSMMSTQGEYPNYCENCGARMDEE